MAEHTVKESWGFSLEKRLHSHLEKIIGQDLVKTSYQYDTIDFEGKDYFVELKGRPRIGFESKKYQDSNTFNSFLVPSCKVLGADKKHVVVFYYFEGDNTLWKCEYNYKWQNFNKGYPSASTQQHYWVPKKCWTQVECPC